MTRNPKLTDLWQSVNRNMTEQDKNKYRQNLIARIMSTSEDRSEFRGLIGNLKELWEGSSKVNLDSSSFGYELEAMIREDIHFYELRLARTRQEYKVVEGIILLVARFDREYAIKFANHLYPEEERGIGPYVIHTERGFVYPREDPNAPTEAQRKKFTSYLDRQRAERKNHT